LISFEREIALETRGNSLIRDNTAYSRWRLILDQFLELLAWFEAFR